MSLFVHKTLLGFLISSRICIEPEKRHVRDINSERTYSFDLIKPDEWGFIYEKYVGQVYESEGYTVTYQGLTAGLIDKGIDLIAVKDGYELYIQCKFWKKKIGKSHIEWILYKASRILYERSSNKEVKVLFVLVTNDKVTNFSQRLPKGAQLNLPDPKNSGFPILQYFLSHNYTQDKVKLEYREIQLPM